MVPTLCIAAFLLTASLACNPTPAPTTGLFVTSAVLSPGDGSECLPFQALSSALKAAASVPTAIVILQPNSATAVIDSDVIVESDVFLKGENAVVNISGRVIVTSLGMLRMYGLRIEGSGDKLNSMFVCLGGVLMGESMKISSQIRGFIEGFGGSLDINTTDFQGLTNSAIMISSAQFNVSVSDSNVIECGDFIEVNANESSNKAVFRLQNVNFNRSGTIVHFRKPTMIAFQLVFQNFSVNFAVQPLFYGNIANSTADISNVTIANSQKVMSGSVVNSTFQFSNCTFFSISARCFDLSSFQGRISISNSRIRNVTSGPIFLLPVNNNPPKSAFFNIVASKVSNVKNFNKNSVSLIIAGNSLTFEMTDSEVYDCSATEGGLFSITSGIVRLSNIVYRDSSSLTFPFFEAKLTVVTVSNTKLIRISNDVIAYTMCIAFSECQFLNISITDSIDPDIQHARGFVLIWSGYSAVTTVNQSYFRNEGFSHPSMAASDSGTIHIYNSLFENLNNNVAFDSISNGFLVIANVTLIRATVNMLFFSGLTQRGLDIRSLQIDVNSKIQTFLFVDGAVAKLSDLQFTSWMTDSLVRVTNGEVTVTNVTVRNLRCFVCRGCLSSQFTVSSLSIEGGESDAMFQFAYSSVRMDNITVKNFICQQLVSLDMSEMTINQGNFSKMMVDSFGGLITATYNSSILLNSVSLFDVFSRLSIKIGLISLESASLCIQKSIFTRFNSTLIYSFQSSVFLSESEFSTGGLLQPTVSKAVLSFGGVLWSVNSQSVIMRKCIFDRLSADDGGVIYLSGAGMEICEISDSEATSNSAKRKGGVLYANNVQVNIINSKFWNNSAAQGGVLYLTGQNNDIFTSLNSSQFFNNIATLDGGGMFYTISNFTNYHNQWANNVAIYGTNFASKSFSFSVLSEATLSPISNVTIHAVSGQRYQSSLLIGCVDEIGQVVVTDNVSKLELISREDHSALIGRTLQQAKQGLFTIPGLTVIGEPGSQVTVSVVVGGNLTQSLFSVSLRECVAGEFYDQYQCKLCTHNTYSFSPTQPCALCPSQASCPEGSLLNLHPGYWRASNTTDEIHDCLVPELCIGGVNSDCFPGQESIMCSVCSPDFFKLNQLQCARCGGMSVSLLKAILAVAVSFTLVMFAMSMERLMLHAVVMDYCHSLRIVANFDIYWPKALGYFFTVVGDVGSMGLTAFANACLGSFSGMSTGLSDLVASALHFSALLSSVIAVGFSLKKYTQKVSKSAVLLTALYVGYTMLPMLFMRALGIFSCFHISDSYYLIYDPQVECWTSAHITISLSLAIPLLLIALIVPFYTLIAMYWTGNALIDDIPQWNFLCLSVFLLRKYALISILMFSNQLALCTQVSLTILVNIGTEVSMYKISGCQSLFFFCVYQTMLVASTMQSFACVIFSASDSYISDNEELFVVVNYACIAVPLVYWCVWRLCFSLKNPDRVVPVNVNLSEGRPETSLAVLSVGGEESVGEAYLRAPSSTPEQVQDESVDPSEQNSSLH